MTLWRRLADQRLGWSWLLWIVQILSLCLKLQQKVGQKWSLKQEELLVLAVQTQRQLLQQPGQKEILS